ncbi:large ribosomal subunit protein mL54 [Prorops nasuta]|uniref:large ribosomal subunit protein mL54 n=1 Tax=Prorops nasuta TaxID=863751 RepID=UPI0034CD9955
MTFLSALRTIFLRGNILLTFGSLQVRNYAAPVKGGQTKTKIKKISTQKVVIPVEKDVKKLLTYCCGTNLLAEGGEDVKLKPDSEYPDWLWNLRLGPPIPLEELDPNSKQYWRRVRKMNLRLNNKMQAVTKLKYVQ